MANAWRCIGSIWCATPTPAATTPTNLSASGPIATTSFAPLMTICRLTGSRKRTSPETCYPTQRGNRKSHRDTIGSTRQPLKAARKRRSISLSMPQTGCEPPPLSGSAQPSDAHNATTTSSMPILQKTSIVSPRSSLTLRDPAYMAAVASGHLSSRSLPLHNRLHCKKLTTNWRNCEKFLTPPRLHWKRNRHGGRQRFSRSSLQPNPPISHG